jgi:protein involved in polysaccharide export with SLBB domain
LMFGGATSGKGSAGGLDSRAAHDWKAVQDLVAGPDSTGAEASAVGPDATAGRGSAEEEGAAAGLGLAGRGKEAGANIGVPGIRGYNVFAGATALAEQRRPGAAQGNGSHRLDLLVRLATQRGRPGTRIPDQPVGPDGAISIPYAGRVKIAGRTPVEVERTIEKLLGPKALDPQALVFVKRSAANSVVVAGEIVGGKRVALSPGGDRLLATLVADPAQDIFAEPGDVLTLVRRPQTFSVFGATGRNAAITFNSDHLSLSEALGKAGGLLDNRADPRAVFLFRYEPVGLVRALGQPIASGAPPGLSPVVYRLDLNEARSYLLARRFPVHDKDIIFVANAEIHPIYRVFRVLSQITGPVQTGFVTCHVAGC